MSLHLFDTAARAKRPFQPLIQSHASIYVCGATVQAPPHLGHMRSGVAFDLLRRWLITEGHTVTFVRNVTDIDDKILKRASESGEPWWAIAAKVQREFEPAYRALDCLPPTVEPLATGHIPDMIALTRRLIAAGAAHERSGGVYFSVQNAADYGALSHQDPGRLPPNNQIPTDTEPRPNPRTDADHPPAPDTLHKQGTRDFALWKGAKPGEPATATWDTPWGSARPGWHLECSAMASRYLGPAFDIHGGGQDLVFPHHENERAQSHAAGGFAQHWMHNALVTVHGNKMSKSLNNSLLVEDVLASRSAHHLRYWLMSGHYRSILEYSPEALNDAAAASDRIENFLLRAQEEVTWIRRPSPDDNRSSRPQASAPDWTPSTRPGSEWVDSFAAALNDDLNTAQALSVLHEAVSAGNVALRRDDGLRADEAFTAATWMTHVLGIKRARTRAHTPPPVGGEADKLINLLFQHRDAARRRHAYERADLIREGLSDLGVDLVDTAAGTTWRHR